MHLEKNHDTLSAVISPEHGFAISTRRFVEVGQTGDALLQLMCGLKNRRMKECTIRFNGFDSIFYFFWKLELK